MGKALVKLFTLAGELVVDLVREASRKREAARVRKAWEAAKNKSTGEAAGRAASEAARKANEGRH